VPAFTMTNASLTFPPGIAKAPDMKEVMSRHAKGIVFGIPLFIFPFSPLSNAISSLLSTSPSLLLC